jgi:hypothetical protein
MSSDGWRGHLQWGCRSVGHGLRLDHCARQMVDTTLGEERSHDPSPSLQSGATSQPPSDRVTIVSTSRTSRVPVPPCYHLVACVSGSGAFPAGVPGRAAGLRRPVVRQALHRTPTTRFEYAEEIRGVLTLRDFAEPELTAWVDARSWTTGDGPRRRHPRRPAHPVQIHHPESASSPRRRPISSTLPRGCRRAVEGRKDRSIIHAAPAATLTERRRLIRVVVGAASVLGALGNQLVSRRLVHKASCRAGDDRSDGIRSDQITTADRAAKPRRGNPLRRWFCDPAESAAQPAPDSHVGEHTPPAWSWQPVRLTATHGSSLRPFRLAGSNTGRVDRGSDVFGRDESLCSTA